MRRGLERYAPEDGFDPGALARNKLIQLVVGKAGLFPGDWALDVQTDTGLLGVNVSRAFTRVKVVATDDTRENLERARENADTEGCAERMRFIQCLPDALPLKDERFFFTTVGLRLQDEEEPLAVLDEIHRATGFYGKVYVAAADLRKMRRKPQGTHAWVFDDETLGEMRGMGFGKVQTMQVAVLPDGARLHLVMAKRFDPEEDDDVEEDDDDGLDE